VPQRYSVSAEKSEENYPPFYLAFYSPEKQPEVDVSEANKDVTLNLVLRIKAGVLVGTVADVESGAPINANVDFRSTTDPRRAVSGSGLTNAKFRVLVPSDTPVLMRVSEPGYEDWLYTRNGVIAPIKLRPDETLNLEIRLKKVASCPAQHALSHPLDERVRCVIDKSRYRSLRYERHASGHYLDPLLSFPYRTTKVSNRIKSGQHLCTRIEAIHA